MHNVYSFNATVVSNQDKRERKNVGVTADGSSLQKAWDKAERKVSQDYPDHDVTLTMGNRQPLHLRPGYREAS